MFGYNAKIQSILRLFEIYIMLSGSKLTGGRDDSQLQVRRGAIQMMVDLFVG